MANNKTIMKDTRVKSAGESQTPIAGAPQKKSGATVVKGHGVKVAPDLPRKNDPSKKKYEGMGLKIGARVTSSRAKTK